MEQNKEKVIEYLTTTKTMLIFPQMERNDAMRGIYIYILRAAKEDADRIEILDGYIKWFKNGEELKCSGRGIVPKPTYREIMRNILEKDTYLAQYLALISDSDDKLVHKLVLRFQ